MYNEVRDHEVRSRAGLCRVVVQPSVVAEPTHVVLRGSLVHMLNVSKYLLCIC